MKRIISIFVLCALVFGVLNGCSSKVPNILTTPQKNAPEQAELTVDFPEKFAITESISVLNEMKQTYFMYQKEMAALTEPLGSGLSDEDFFNIDFDTPEKAIFYNVDQNFASLLLDYDMDETVDFSSDLFGEFMAEAPGQFMSYIIPALISTDNYSSYDIEKMHLVSWLSKSKTITAPPEYPNYILLLGYWNTVVITSFTKDDSGNIRYRCNNIIPGLSLSDFNRQYTSFCQEKIGIDVSPYAKHWTDLSALID